MRSWKRKSAEKSIPAVRLLEKTLDIRLTKSAEGVKDSESFVKASARALRMLSE
uniref:Uncharacterized protein n=1 Tax=Rhizophagus irregularis (strain DAOM 181602 / DAOM 197198 / MUCL 43194) TaxID=747089 RepID=U9SR33_RHIID